MSIDTLEEIFHPQAIAVVGASGNPGARGYGFTASLLEYATKTLLQSEPLPLR